LWKIFFVLILAFLPLFVFSQQKYDKTTSTILSELKYFQSNLEELSPFDENEMEDIVRFNFKAEELLLFFLNKKQVANFPKDTISFFVAESKDKNFAIFNWHENLGGSFRTFRNIFFWKNKKGVPNAIPIENEETPYFSIFDIKNSTGEILYLILGSGISCNTCRYEKALLLKLKESDLEEIFSYQIDFRFHEDIKGFNFDEEKKILSYEYIEEDCESNDCWVKGSFEFDGETFK